LGLRAVVVVVIAFIVLTAVSMVAVWDLMKVLAKPVRGVDQRASAIEFPRT